MLYQKNWYVPNWYTGHFNSQYGVRSLRALCAMMRTKTNASRVKTRRMKRAGTRGRDRGLAEVKRLQHFVYIMPIRHAPRVATTRRPGMAHMFNVNRSAINVLVHGRRRTSRPQGARRAFVATIAHQVQRGSVELNLGFYLVIETVDRHVFQSNGLTHSFAFRKIHRQHPLVPSSYQMHGQTVLYQAFTRVSYCLPIREICRLVQLVRWYVPKNQLVRDSLTPKRV